MVAQLLSKETVEYIRNRKANQNRGVCFSFWYKPDDALSNGDKNQAYAQILYNDRERVYSFHNSLEKLK